MVVAVRERGAASFENDPATDWFLLVEEAVDPGAVIASALDSAVGESDYLSLDQSCEAIAAAELSASCAGRASDRLPDNVRHWVDTHPHQPHDYEIDQAVHAVQRVRTESEPRDYWDRSVDRDTGGFVKSTISSRVWSSLGPASYGEALAIDSVPSDGF
jgi:Domain of unknown function (DUF4259)